jgi:hypothetical protein
MWLKLSDDFFDDCARAALSDAAVRTHLEGLAWVMRRETGGHLDRLDLRRLAETADPDAAVRELLAAGFWRPNTDRSWTVVHGMEHQPEPDLIAKRREKAADRMRRVRRRQAGLDDPSDAPRDASHSRERSRERSALPGSGRVGSGRESQQTNPAQDEEPWPDVANGDPT